MLKIYTDLSLLPLGYPVDLLIPFIGVFNEEDKPGKMMSTRFKEYQQKGPEFIKLVSLDECDACLLPITYPLVRGNISEFEKSIAPFVEKVEKSGKKIFVFLGHDDSFIDVKINNAIIFNGAISKSQQPKNVFAYPHFFEDYIEVYSNSEFALKRKSDNPTVGFCGFASPLGLPFGKAKIIGLIKLIANYLGIMKRFPERSSHSYRSRAIISLRNSNKIKTNFKIKQKFAFGPQGQLNTGENVKESDYEFRSNFVRNITDSDFTLCVRGIGNNSIRFFETMCCGRIPVFLNTDCVLPFDFIIDWRKLCVWVEENEIDKIGQITNAFNDKISEEDYINLQQNLRFLWEKYLSPVGFFQHLHLFLKEIEK